MRPSYYHATQVALSALAVMAGVVIFRCRAPAPAPHLHPLASGPGQAFYVAAAKAEVDERKRGVGRFRGSPWSQDDDFHNEEAKFIKGYARSHKTQVGSLLETLDRGMRDRWPTGEYPPPEQKVIPCRPRLSY